MSLDSIVSLNISVKSTGISAAGFGIPLIVSELNAWPGASAADAGALEPLVRVFNSPAELVAAHFKTDSPLVKMAAILCAQKPGIKNFKVGLRGPKMGEALTAIYLADSDFYGMLLESSKPEDIKAAADWTKERRVIFGADLSARATDLKGDGYDRTFLMYHPDSNTFAAAALMARMLGEETGAPSWAFKRLTGVTPYSLTTEQAAELDKNCINRYTKIKEAGVTLQGKAVSGQYIDVVVGIDWLHVRMQERLFGLLMANNKIPYTNKGVDLVRCEIMAQLDRAVQMGILAAEPKPTVSAPNVADIDTKDKEKRQLPNVNFTGTLSGAIHSLTINGTVSL